MTEFSRQPPPSRSPRHDHFARQRDSQRSNHAGSRPTCRKNIAARQPAAAPIQHVAGIMRPGSDPLAADQHGQHGEQQAALGYSQIKAAANPAAVAVWAEGKLCDAAVAAEHRQPSPNVSQTEPVKSIGKIVWPGADDEHFQQIGGPACRQRASQHPRDGPAAGGIELVKHQQHQHHPQPVPERLEHVQIAEIGVNVFACVLRLVVPMPQRHGDRHIERQSAATAASSSTGQEEISGKLGRLLGMTAEVVLAWQWRMAVRVCINFRQTLSSPTPGMRTAEMSRLVRYQLWIAAAAGVIFFTNLGGAALFDMDEALYATCAREMLERGNLIVPWFNGAMFPEKPPLMFWTMMGGFELCGGVNELGARFFSAVMGVGTALVAFHLGRILFNRAWGSGPA